ncbi:MAG: hypothetical protein IPI31_00330 [Bacteroidetes bacterium]|nr:hypothetical protein [Bacteroidota bacterium]
MATIVYLRQKKISGNRHRLYLDFCPAISHPKTGEPTQRELLKLYLFDKQYNKESLLVAQMEM